VDEKFEADIGGKSGNEGDGELNYEFEVWAEVFFVVPEAEGKQGEDAENNDNELICSADESGGVNSGGFVKGKSARLD
jgi:hypothetical protein